MSEIRKTLITGMVAVGFLVGFTAGIRYWMSTWDKNILEWMAVALFWGVLVLVFGGLPLAYYFGREKATGYLAGVDAMFDNVVGKGIDAMERRQKAPASPPAAYLAPPNENGDPYHRPVITPASAVETGFTPPTKSNGRL